MFITGLRLPEDIERGSAGGPLFNTTVKQFGSGFEKRNINWSQATGEWDASFGILKKFDSGDTDLSGILATFHIAQGRGHSFRFKDWSDFEIGQENGTATAPQQIGLGDGANKVFPVFKRYDNFVLFGDFLGSIQHVFIKGFIQFFRFV